MTPLKTLSSYIGAHAGQYVAQVSTLEDGVEGEKVEESGQRGSIEGPEELETESTGI